MKIWLIILAFLALALPATAQTLVSNQSGVAFLASSDHNTVIAGTQTPVVDHYDLTVIAQAPNTATGFTFGLGKPTPDAANIITVKPIASFGALAQGAYTVTVAAVGPGGSAASVPSDPFVRATQPAAPGKPTVVAK